MKLRYDRFHPQLILTIVTAVCFGLLEYAHARPQVDTDSLLSEAKQLFDEAREKEALNTYLEVLEKDENNFEALWHSSLLHARIGFRLDNKDEMMERYQKALEYAEKTMEYYPGKGHSHFVYAIAHGRISDLSDNKTRIEKSHIVKEHAEKAVEKIPEYAPAWILLGVWHSEVANINSARKLAAGVVSEGIPDGASNEKAEEYIKKALELDPAQAIRFKLDLGRHYLRTGETEKAVQALQEVLELEPQNEIDEWNLERAGKILEEIK